MHAHELIQLAGIIATNSKSFVAATLPVESQPVDEFFANFQRRNRSWEMLLLASSANPDQVLDLAESVFTTELLTRVWAATLVGRCRAEHNRMLEQRARDAFYVHMSLSNRIMRHLLENQATLDKSGFARVNVVRRKVDRWTVP